jgi:hypothetical protein
MLFILATHKRQRSPLPRLPEALGRERVKKNAPTEAVGCILDIGREAKKEILEKCISPDQ